MNKKKNRTMDGERTLSRMSAQQEMDGVLAFRGPRQILPSEDKEKKQ
jgi:hypothetical protein